MVRKTRGGALLLKMKYSKYIFVIVPLMHLAGFLGAQIPNFAPLFRALTPFHLTTCLVLLLLFHQSWNFAAAAYCVLAFLAGFVIEAIGVHTGLIFGTYQYGATLGYKVLEVPLLIGANWLILTYCAGILADRLVLPLVGKAACAAALVTVLDVLIEPVAMKSDFWSWKNNTVPLQNYVAWYLIAWVLLVVFYYLPFNKKNQLAPLLFISQFLFFAFHNLTYLFH